MRVVHLLDPAECGDEAMIACSRAVALGAGVEHEVWIIGSAADEERAAEYGLTTDVRVPRLSGPKGLMRRRLASVAGQRPMSRASIVQAWSVGGTELACDVLGGSAPVVGVIVRTPCDATAPSAVRRFAGRAQGPTLAVLDPRTVGWLAEHAETQECSRRVSRRTRILPPPVAASVPVAERNVWRARLGIEPGERVVGLLSDPPWAGSASQLAYGLGLDHVLGSSVISIVRSGVREYSRSARFVRGNAHRWMVARVEISVRGLIAASDVCVCDVSSDRNEAVISCGLTSIVLAMSMGVPVVGVPECLPDFVERPGTEPPPMIAGSGRRGPGRVALPTHRALSDEALRIEHAHAARAWLERAGSRASFEQTLSGIWEEVCNVRLAGARAAEGQLSP